MKAHSIFDRLARKWWFYLLIVILSFLPSYTTLPLNPVDTPKLVIEVLSRPLLHLTPTVFPIFKVIPILLFLGILLVGDRLARIFDGYVALIILLCATLQNIAFTQSFGFALLTGNLVIYCLLAVFWMWETVIQRNDLTYVPKPAWKYWVAPLAILAFWFPASLQGGIPSPDFSMAGLVANEAGVTFCMMLPVFLAILLLRSMRMNLALLRVSGFIGSITGLLNVGMVFMNPLYGWWMGVLHLPLLLISFYAFVISFLQKSEETGSFETEPEENLAC
ncbi:MAG: hypothetical protein M1281_17730 [Chloroflexi bacterium]|nr:hypothetical protein [Chloroflexota bacterium]